MAAGPMFKLTRQRRIILEELRLARFHPTADEIYARVRKRLPRISLGTIYRNLEILAARGKVRKLNFAGSQRRFEDNLTAHHHVRCMECGKIDDVILELPFAFEEMAVSPSGYEICDVRLEFLGLCPECKINKRQCAGEL